MITDYSVRKTQSSFMLLYVFAFLDGVLLLSIDGTVCLLDGVSFFFSLLEVLRRELLQEKHTEVIGSHCSANE